MIPLSDENRTRNVPVASRTILVTCCLVFLWQSFGGDWGRMAAQALGFTPAWFFAGGAPEPAFAWVPYAANLITYQFLHAGWLHLAGNMLCLWIFGDDVEDAFGPAAFIAFYLMAGIAAALAQALLDVDSRTPVIGASGAVSGLFGAFLVLHPRSHINVLVPIFIVVDIVRLPAWVVLTFWFAVQLLYDLFDPAAGGGVAFRAHIGGFLAGLVMTPLFVLATGRRASRATG